jgi:hypothetical protein
MSCVAVESRSIILDFVSIACFLKFSIEAVGYARCSMQLEVISNSDYEVGPMSGMARYARSLRCSPILS